MSDKREYTVEFRDEDLKKSMKISIKAENGNYSVNTNIQNKKLGGVTTKENVGIFLIEILAAFFNNVIE
jgi:hypothetical protein